MINVENKKFTIDGFDVEFIESDANGDRVVVVQYGPMRHHITFTGKRPPDHYADVGQTRTLRRLSRATGIDFRFFSANTLMNGTSVAVGPDGDVEVVRFKSIMISDGPSLNLQESLARITSAGVVL